MEFSHGSSPANALEVLSEYWPLISLYGVVLGIAIVRFVRRPMVPAFSLSRRQRDD